MWKLSFFIFGLIFNVFAFLPFQGKNILELVKAKPYNNDYTKVVKEAFKDGYRSLYFPSGEYRLS